MKTLRIVSVLLLAIIMVAGCKKKEETPVLDATTEEAASIMATSFCTGNSGTMTQVEDAVELSGSVMKSTLTDSSFTISSATGAVITYSYHMNYSYGWVNANYYSLNYTGSGDYSAPYVSASINASGDLNVTGFVSGSYFVVNGQSDREGTFAMKIGNKTSMTGTVATSLSNFKISKSSGLLESGTATIVVSGSTNTGRNFGFTGTLVYTGNYTGTLTISGKQYYINISTGTVE